MKKGLNLRIYPNVKQTKLIESTFCATRFVYNKVLGLKKELWEEYKLSYTPKLNSFKDEWDWLNNIPSQALANSYMDCMNSFKNFFNNISKKNNSQQKYPKFKKKGKSRDSFRIACTYSKKQIGDIRIINRNHIKIPKLGVIQFANYGDLDWSLVHIYNITVSKSHCGNYYAALCVELPDAKPLEQNEYATGFDLGLKDFLIDSEGIVTDNPKYFRKSQDKLASEQRKFSKMTKGSTNYKEQKLKIAKLHEKIKNQRKDFQHKVSSRIINENQVIVSEDLKPSNMLKNHKLAKSIQDASFGSFCNMIDYKAKWYGRTYIKVGSFYPSSKLCNCCGYKNTTLTLADREWKCPNCHALLDRDKNAALNILDEGIKILNNSLQIKEKLLYFNKMFNKYPDGTGESDELCSSKPIDTDYISNLEWENRNSLKAENQLSLAVD